MLHVDTLLFEVFHPTREFFQFIAVELSLPVLTTKACRGWDSITQPSACEANALRLRHRCDYMLT